MAKEKFLNSLFDAHTKDLNDVYPEQGDIVVCPICLRRFSREAINEGDLTDGHVWPQYFRKNSEKAKDMHVLLCRECNHDAGAHGDSYMQLEEQIRDGEHKGEWFGSRRIQLLRGPSEKPIELNAKIVGDFKNFTLSGRVDKNKKWVDANPKDQDRFHKIIENREKVSILIHPYKGHKLEKVPVGWITSAYLMAFYALGYRYILHQSLDLVREYIKSSITLDVSEQQALPHDENFTIKEYKSERYPEPELVFIIPLKEGELVYLQINYIRYEIRLPFRYSQSILNELFRINRQRIEELRTQESEDIVAFTIPINCTKLEVHDCVYDYLLGKALPA